MEIGSISEVTSATIAFLAFGSVIYEYTNTRRQRRLELAQGLARDLEVDNALRFAVTSLDWATGLVPVPEEWRGTILKPSIVPDLRSMRTALNPTFLPELENNAVGLMYRHSFVALFNHLERARELAGKRAILIEDLAALGWISTQLMDWDYAPEGTADRFFMDAVRSWYQGTGLDSFIGDLAARFPKKKMA